MKYARIWEMVPAVVLHLVTAAIHGTAAAALGSTHDSVYTGGLVAITLGVPVAGMAALLAGYARAGALTVLLSYVGTAALIIYGHLGLGLMGLALNSPPGTGWKLVFFGTAVALPLLQVKGVLDAAKVLWPEPEEEFAGSGAALDQN